MRKMNKKIVCRAVVATVMFHLDFLSLALEKCFHNDFDI